MSKIKPAFVKIFKQRAANSHKGDYGKVFICAGSEGMLGAAALCSRSALRAGTGLVYLSVPVRYYPSINLATPEVIITNELPKGVTAVAVGPGLGKQRASAIKLLAELSRQGIRVPIVLDADGLTAYVDKQENLKKLHLNLILTPHPGEMAALSGKPIAEIQKHREEVAAESARKFKAVVVLKGHRTVVADDKGHLFVNDTGNPGMATAGTGDVLTGIIAGLAAQGISSWEAAVAGVNLHGLAGDLAAKEKGEYGMIASDLVEMIPYAINKIS